MASFGEEIRRERELRDISLKEIAEATKISIRFLEALEQNNFDILPGGIFNRGFVRSYARFIGLDSEEMVNAYLHEVSLREARRGRPDGSPGARERKASGVGNKEPALASGIFRPEHRPLGGAENRPTPRREQPSEFIPSMSRIDHPASPPEADGRASMALWVLAAVVVAIGAGVLALSFIPRGSDDGSSERLNHARGARLSKKAGGAKEPELSTGSFDASDVQPGLVAGSAGEASRDTVLDPLPSDEESSRAASVEPEATPVVPVPPATAPVSDVPPAEHDIRVRAVEVTRIQLECASQLVLDQELWPNQMKTSRCLEPVVISADNAGAVLVSLDGGPDALLGAVGERIIQLQVAPRPGAPASPRPVTRPAVPEAEPKRAENAGD